MKKMQRICTIVLVSIIALGAAIGTASAQSCLAPYHVTAPDGRCVWSCAEGTQPDPATGVCVCQPGLEFTGADSSGRIVCTSPSQQGSSPRLPIFENLPRLNVPDLALPQIPDGDRPEIRLPDFGASGDSEAERSDLAAFYDLNANPYDFCARMRAQDHEREPKCTTYQQQPEYFRVTRQLELIVERDRPMRAEVQQEGEYELQFVRPSNPAPNPECDASITGVPTACVAECVRLDYYAMYESGEPGIISAEPYGDGDRCDAPSRQSYDFQNAGIARAYDACANEAARHNMADWNHFVTISLPHRYLGVYMFEDNYTEGTRGNWRLHTQMQVRAVDYFGMVSAKVLCR